jgi:hypothetical protein
MQEQQEGSQSVDGFYEHKETGVVVELINEPGFGTPLTNAYIKAGFTFVGTTDPRPKAEVKETSEKVEPKAEVVAKTDSKASK